MRSTTRSTLTRTAALTALLALTLVPAPASAWRQEPAAAWWDRSAAGRLVDVSILVDGRAAPLYSAPERWDRHYFEAFKGRPYALQVHNRTGRRVAVLIAVDGLNVVSGERSRLAREESMYVLDPYESAVIRGWRTSLEEVRRFVFVDERRSYASRTGQANGDMGWIRVLAFEESRPLAWFGRPGVDRGDEGDRRERAKGVDGGEPSERLTEPQAGNGPAPRAGAGGEAAAPQTGVAPAAPSESPSAGMTRSAPQADAFPGTGWGERRGDPVREVWFVPAAAPTDQLVFRYEYAEGLRALGILPARDRLRDREQGELGFARPPLR